MSVRPRQSLVDSTLVRPNAIDSIPRSANQMWLDKNENLDPELLLISEGVLNSIPPISLATYPESGALYQAISSWIGVSPSFILLTPGSDGAIRLVFEAFVEHGDAVIHTAPSFAMYSIYCQMFGAIATTLEYEYTDNGPNLDLDNLFTVLNNIKPKLFCLPNPDSPTGTVLAPEILSDLLKECERLGTLLLVDEAYFPFYNLTVASWVERSKNLIVVRTFAKAWGAAGLRIGYALGHPETIKYLHQMRPMYEVSTLAVEYMCRMFNFRGEVEQSVSRLNAVKNLFQADMKLLGYKVTVTHGNFINIDFGKNSEKIHEQLSGKVLYRKSFEHPSLRGLTRFSVGSEQVMQRLTELIKGVDKGDL